MKSILSTYRLTYLPSALTVIAAGSVIGFFFLFQIEAKGETVLAPSNNDSSELKMDPTILKDKAMKIMEKHCYACHGVDKQKGDIRLDQLETIDPVDLKTLYSDANEAVLFEDMPPEDEKQPTKAERKILIKWLESQVTGDAADALAEKLRRSEYGNVVKHQELFSGKHSDHTRKVKHK